MDEQAVYTPKLTLDPTADQAREPEAPAVSPQIQAQTEQTFDINSLSPEEQAAVREFSKQIDVTNSSQVLSYGTAAQQNIASFSEQALGKVRTKDLGQVGGMLSDLVVELEGMDFDESEKKGLKGLFKKAGSNIAALKAQYSKAEVNVDKIAQELEKHEVQLLKDIATMDKMYEMNLAYHKELTMYIIAGKLRAAELRETELPRLQAKAQESGAAEDAQAASDYANMLGRFEKHLYDLELSRMISVQMSPQIRMIQNNDSLMVEKIRTSVTSTIPLWKNQMVLALSMHHAQQAMEAQRAVSDTTNALLRKNAETLKMGSVEIARESERGIVEIETLKHTNEQLIQTLDEVRQIQEDGRAKRAQAEVELTQIEAQLKQKLLEIKG